MFRKWFVVCAMLLQMVHSDEIDFNLCPNGRTTAPSDSRWPKIFLHDFQLSIEITTDIETLHITQSFIAAYQDMISFRNDQTTLRIYDDFQLNERLIINEQNACQRSEIESNGNSLFIISQYLKPSILLGFDGRNHYNPTFNTRYIGKEIIRGGILTRKFQSCFYIDEQKLTINATYYLTDALPTDTSMDILQIDILSNNYPYTYNIVRYISNPSMIISTPSGVFCPNRIDTKQFPENLPWHVFFHAEEYTLPSNITSGKIDSTSRLIDQVLQFERIDYRLKNDSTSNRLLIDHATNFSYIYTDETEQCHAISATAHSMRTTNELLFQFDNEKWPIEYHYTGLSECGREYTLCHRWIGQRDLDHLTEQFEWYSVAEFNHIDMQEFIPIKVHMKTILKNEPRQIIEQEISKIMFYSICGMTSFLVSCSDIFHYDPWPNSIESIDTTVGQCYRTLGSSYHLNYAILRLTLNNDAKHPVHRFLLALENELHLRLASDLQVRHLRLSSFEIDSIDQNVYATFTLIDNPIGFSKSLDEPSLFELIRQLARQINDGRFYVRVEDGAFDLRARRDSLRILVLFLSPSQNQTDDFIGMANIHENTTQREILIYKHIGWRIVALWTSSALLGLIVTLVIGFVIAMHNWTPSIQYERT